MKRIVLFWIPLLLLLLVNCTTESFDFGDQEGILVEGSGGGGCLSNLFIKYHNLSNIRLLNSYI
ncbi:hypothetical protein F3F42_11345 [Bacteroides ovatus]|nr:hypothetical protein F3F42_11345 [Bacteroides ovatus]KAA3916774.1 hypothetical protein F3D73_12880 [Bacteroides ovatus]